uniref:NADH-ubiquinone oxidoreductase chain 2 n=1 Tax=Rhyzodiastes puetzi TaxID=2983424 RepID=A0A977TJ38_9CARA|nr:NADH dehydrogenase subunit 2 [Rhyzodiastes puetzi]UXW64212.1 NADH dehydrogenase subunit 2 [Rhyzodiastes puetzi]
MKPLYKLLFFPLLITSTLISISSSNWMSAWMGLEINLLCFIPLMSQKNLSNNSEATMKYFLIQSMASSLLIFSILLNLLMLNINSTLYTNNYLLMIMNTSLMLKIGIAPFHFWFVEIIEKINWMNSTILLTWQKLAPMMLLSYTTKSMIFIMIICLITTFTGSIMGLNQTSLRKIMAFSSLNHLGWMLSTLLINKLLWMIYFFIYLVITITITMLFHFLKIFFLKQMFTMPLNSFMIKFNLSLNFLSLGGLPPFLGFFPKWLVILKLSSSFNTLLLFMIFMSLITLYFYLRIIYSYLTISSNKLNYNFINYYLSDISLFNTFLTTNSLIIFINLFYLI